MNELLLRRRVAAVKSLPEGSIDLGLPSGKLWSVGNIVKDANGVYSISQNNDYGCFFSWGNIVGYNTNEIGNSGYSFSTDNYNNTSGASLSSSISPSDSNHDAAVACIGKGWHMPTLADFAEITNTKNTSREWVAINNVTGWLLTSLFNGEKIFFPAAGWCTDKNVRGRGGSSGTGQYWSSNYSNATNAYKMYFVPSRIQTNLTDTRRSGMSIRPIWG